MLVCKTSCATDALNRLHVRRPQSGDHPLTHRNAPPHRLNVVWSLCRMFNCELHGRNVVGFKAFRSFFSTVSCMGAMWSTSKRSARLFHFWFQSAQIAFFNSELHGRTVAGFKALSSPFSILNNMGAVWSISIHGAITGPSSMSTCPFAP